MNILIGALLGGAAGFAVGYFGRCRSGRCPLTSNPWVSTTAGVVIGVLITLN